MQSLNWAWQQLLYNAELVISMHAIHPTTLKPPKHHDRTSVTIGAGSKFKSDSAGRKRCCKQVRSGVFHGGEVCYRVVYGPAVSSKKTVRWVSYAGDVSIKLP